MCFTKPYETEEELQNGLRDVNEKIAKEENVEFGGTAFVVFKDQDSVEKVLAYYSLGGIWGWFTRICWSLSRCRPYKWKRELLTDTTNPVRVRVT